jgi:2-phospho-L-lactate guanylyltransferase
MTLALVPVKRLGAAKSRLAGHVAPADRDALTLAMLADVVEALRGVAAIDRVAVVTPDPVVAEAARAAGAIGDLRQAPGLNPALDAAAAELLAPGEPLLVVLGDVAGATVGELGQLFLALHGLGGSGVVLAAARDGGTAALLRAPGDAIPSRFGADSAKAHRREAEARGVPLRELALPSLAIDLDRPEDIAALLASEGAAPRTRALLARLTGTPA